MAIPSAPGALATLEEGHSEIESLLARLSDDELIRPARIGGGEWSAKDLLGHLAFWEELALETVAAWPTDQQPSVLAIFGGGSAAVDAANARNQEITARQSLAEVRERAGVTHARLLEAIRRLSAAEWRARPAFPTPRPKDTLAGSLGSVLGAPRRPFGHAFAHLDDLRTYVESVGGREASRSRQPLPPEL
jgi:DinB superfamily